MAQEPRPEHRIAKLLARAGVASRREIERMIADGRVALDGRVLDTPATLLASLRGVTVDGRPVEAPAPARLFVYHKPPGLLVTENDPAGRPTIYDRLPTDLPRVVPVGRLDLATEGLLLLTTDGGLKRTLELPATGVERAYRARAYGDVTQAQLEELIHGVEIDGIRYGPIDANMERRTGANVWIEMILTEGKNREVRRVLDHLGLQVSRLIRTRYGPFILGDLPSGGVGEVRQHDLVAFVQSLKQGRATDTRVEAGERRTATRSAARAAAPEAPARAAREPDAPRRTRAPMRPSPVATSTATAATPRPGFRTPRTSDAKEQRAARFAGRARDDAEPAPRAARPRSGGEDGRPARPSRTPASDTRARGRPGQSANADTGARRSGGSELSQRTPADRRPTRDAAPGRARTGAPDTPRPGGKSGQKPSRPTDRGGSPRPRGGTPRGKR